MTLTPTPRQILFLCFHREDHVADLAAACKRRGHGVEVIDVFDTQSLRRALDQARFDLVFTHNLYIFDQRGEEGHRLEQELISLQRPIVAWYVDSPFATGAMQRVSTYTFGPFPNHIHHWVIDSGWIPALRERGLSVEYLALGVGPKWLRLQARSGSSFSDQVTFVGKPWEGPEELSVPHPSLESFFLRIFLKEFEAFADSKRSQLDVSEEMLRQTLSVLSSQLKASFCTMDQRMTAYSEKEAMCFEALKGQIPRPLYSLLLLLRGRMAMIFSYGQLTTYLRALQSLGLRVYGSDRWSNYLPSPASRRLSDTELIDCFASSAVSFCYTKQQFVHGIHERPLLIFGAGGFALTDDRLDLHDAWGGRPDFAYGSVEEAQDKVAFFLKDRAAREIQQKKAQEWILRSMTYEHRVYEFEALMEKIL